MALIFSTHSSLWKLPFEIIVSEIYSYSHVKLEVNRIKVHHRDEVFVVGFYSCRKVGVMICNFGLTTKVDNMLIDIILAIINW